MHDNEVVVAVMFKPPRQVAWCIRVGEKSWNGKGLLGLAGCYQKQVGNDETVTLAITFVDELNF